MRFSEFGQEKIDSKKNRKMYYRKNEKLQSLLQRRHIQKNVESIVDIFIHTAENADFFNALDAYMTLHVISNWCHKRDVKDYPCITPKLAKIMETLYNEIRWKSESIRRKLTIDTVFVSFNGENHSIKEIYNMLEDQQDPYYETVLHRIKSLLSD